jgi:hypothetical protein
MHLRGDRGRLTNATAGTCRDVSCKIVSALEQRPWASHYLGMDDFEGWRLYTAARRARHPGRPA